MKKWALLSTFSISMAYLESAVVTYLREVYYPRNLTSIFPLKMMSPNNFAIELGRETATIVMFLSIALLSGEKGWRKFYALLYIFGLWDISYYAWLKIFIGWPLSIKDFDVLFLIPLPWVGPVYSPFIIASFFALTGGFVIINRNVNPEPELVSILNFLLGSALIIFIFIYPSIEILRRNGAKGFQGFIPLGFPLIPYFIGLLLLAFGVLSPLKYSDKFLQ